MSDFLLSDLEKNECNVYQFYALIKNKKKLFDTGANCFFSNLFKESFT